MKEYKEKIEEFCLKHQNRWLDPIGDHDPSHHTVFALTQRVSDRINGLLETIEIYKKDVPHIAKKKIEGRIKELKKEVEEMADSIDTSKDPYFDREFEEGDEVEDKSALEIERDGKKIIISKVKYNQAEQDFGYCMAINQPQIDFWRWYLANEFEQIEQPNKKGEKANENKAIKVTSKKEEAHNIEAVEVPLIKSKTSPESETLKTLNEKESPQKNEEVEVPLKENEQIEQPKKDGQPQKVKPPTDDPILQTTFEQLFKDHADIEMTFKAMRKCRIINDANKWIYGGKKAAIVAVIAVLKKRDKLKEVSKEVAAKLLAEKIGVTISERTTRNESYRKEDLVKELTALIN